MEGYAENLDQYIREDKKIVTFSWLSVELNIPVNTAKQLLWAYLQKHPQLQATYLVSGETATDKIFRVVAASELDDAKKAFKRLTGVHVFSIQESTPKDSALLVSEDVALRRSMIDNPDAKTHPLLDGRYNAVSYAAGRELRRGGSGVRPEPAKAKSLPPPDTKPSKVMEEKAKEKEEAPPPLTKAKTTVAEALTVREGVKSTAQPKGMMQFFAKGSKAKAAEGDEEKYTPQPIKQEKKEEEAPKRSVSAGAKEDKAKNFFAPKVKSEPKADEEPAKPKKKDDDSSEKAAAQKKQEELKAATKKIVTSDDEEALTPLNASQHRKKRIIEDYDEDPDFFKPPTKAAAATESKEKKDEAKLAEENKVAKKPKKKKKEEDKNDGEKKEAKGDGEPKPKKKKKKEEKEKKNKEDGEKKDEEKKKKKAKKDHDKEKDKDCSPKKKEGRKRKGSDLDDSGGGATPKAPAVATKSFSSMLHPSQSSASSLQPPSALSVGSSTGSTQKKKVKQTITETNAKGYTISRTIEVEVDDEAPPPEPKKEPEVKKPAPSKDKDEKKEEEKKAEAKKEEPKKTAQATIMNFLRKK